MNREVATLPECEQQQTHCPGWGSANRLKLSRYGRRTLEERERDEPLTVTFDCMGHQHSRRFGLRDKVQDRHAVDNRRGSQLDAVARRTANGALPGETRVGVAAVTTIVRGLAATGHLALRRLRKC